MRTLTELRARIIRFYNSADIYILPAIKFIIALLLLFAINKNYGYMESLNNMFIVVILSVVCAFLPLTGTAAISLILIVIHCFGISVEVGLFAACLYLLLFILVIRFVVKDSLAIVIAPIAFKFYIPSVIPVTLGMLGRISSALTAVTAVVSAYFLKELPSIAVMTQNEDFSSLEILNALIDGIVNNAEMIMNTIIFAAVVIIVCLIRKLCTTYGWLISAAVGNGIYIVLSVVGSFFLDIEINYAFVIIGALISLFINLVIAFFKFNAKYSGSRYLQFEDDDYYYYVKVIPKAKASLSTDDYDDDDEEEIYFTSEDKMAAPPRNRNVNGRPASNQNMDSRPVHNQNVNGRPAPNQNPQMYNTQVNVSYKRPVSEKPPVSGDTQIINHSPDQKK
jgi:hypothetical protein